MAVLKRNKIIKFSIILFIFLQKLSLHSQIDTLNRTNDKGSKIGYWKVFYDSKIEKTHDSLKSVYVGFEYYINGDLFRGILDKKNYSKGVIKYSPNESVKNKKLLNGIILYYDKKNTLSFKEEFSDGLITRLYCYSYDDIVKDNNGNNRLWHEELLDFTRTYNNNNNSYYYEVKNYKIFKDVYEIKKSYVIHKKKNKRKYIKI